MKKKKNKDFYRYFTIYLSYFFLIFLHSSTALKGQNFEYEFFYTEQGLPDNYIFDFDINQNGDIWISTRNGISIYDGFNFISVKSIPTEANYRQIKFDSNGKLWLITNKNELSINVYEKILIYDPINKTVSPINEVYPESKTLLSQKDNYVLKTDLDNNLCLIGFSSSPIIYLLDGRLKEFNTIYTHNHNTAKVNRPNIVFSSQPKGDSIAFENIKTGKQTIYYAPQVKYAIEEENKLIAKAIPSETNNNVDKNTFELFGYSSFRHVRKENTYFIGAKDKLFFYDANNDTSIDLSEQLGSKIQNSVITNMKLQGENLWVSTSRGMIKASPKNVLFKNSLAGKQLSIRNLIAEDNENILVCTERGIYRINIATEVEELLVPDIHSYSITKIDSANYIVGSHNNFSQKWNINEDSFDVKNPIYTGLKQKGKGAHLFYYKDYKTDYWLTSSLGISRYYIHNDSIAPLQQEWNNSPYMESLHPNPINNKKLFLGRPGSFFEMDIDTESIKKIEALNSIIISAIVKDSKEDNILWIGTKYEGLLKFNYDKLEIVNQYKTSNGLNNNNVHSILFDRSDNIWLSTDYGLAILDKKTDEISTLTTVHGLHENEFNRHSVLSLGDSLFIYGGVDGLTYFDPNKANESSAQNPTKIIGCSFTDNRSGKNINQSLLIDKNNKIKVGPNQLNYKLLISKPQYPFDQTIKYLIAGISEDWQYTQNNTIPIENLIRGENKLLISRQLGANKWSPTKTTTLFSPTPWYLSYWFYMLLFISILLSIIYYLNVVKSKSVLLTKRIQKEVDIKTTELRLKNEKLEKIKNLNERLLTIIGHDLRSPLISLGNISKSFAYLSENGDVENSLKLSQTIEKNATSSLKLIDRLLAWGRLKRAETLTFENFNLSSLIHTAIQDNIEYSRSKNIHFEFNLDDSITCQSDQESLLVILRNLLNNAIKFSLLGDLLKIKTIQIGKKVEILIIDNGLGISTELNEMLITGQKINPSSGTAKEIGLGMGLTISYELALNINAVISFSNNKPNGTIASIVL